MLKFEIIHCPLTDVLLFDLFLTTQLFCFPCHCYYQAGDLLTSDCCSLHQAGACCRCFPSLTGTVTIGLLSLCPCITSLEFLSCSSCAVPPFELYSGGAFVLIIAPVIFDNICLFSLLL